MITFPFTLGRTLIVREDVTRGIKPSVLLTTCLNLLTRVMKFRLRKGRGAETVFHRVVPEDLMGFEWSWAVQF